MLTMGLAFLKSYYLFILGLEGRSFTNVFSSEI